MDTPERASTSGGLERELRERGASEAQVERYEAAFRSGAEAVRQTGAELDATLFGLARGVQELADV